MATVLCLLDNLLNAYFSMWLYHAFNGSELKEKKPTSLILKIWLKLPAYLQRKTFLAVSIKRKKKHMNEWVDKS